MRPYAQKVEDQLSHSASRIVALFPGTLSSLSEPPDIEPEHLRELQVLGRSMLRRRTPQLKLLLIEKEKHLISQKEEIEKEMVRKLSWVQNRMVELRAEETAVERSLTFHNNVEEFTVRSMEALKRAQSSREAVLIGWQGCSFNLTSRGIDRLSSLTLSESIFAEILRQIGDRERTSRVRI